MCVDSEKDQQFHSHRLTGVRSCGRHRPQRLIDTTDHALAQAALTSGDTEAAIYTRLTLLLDKTGAVRTEKISEHQ